MSMLESLNNAQYDAVTAPLGPVRVLAGAGSGKTRVLVARIAWLIETEQTTPHGILAVTFTNKAALEMRTRLETVLNRPLRSLWLGTFHSLCHRLLRLHPTEAHLDPNFQIMDSDDQLRLCKRLLKERNVDDKIVTAKTLQSFINHHKDEGRRASHIERGHNFAHNMMIDLYTQYQSICAQSSLVDFSEILLRTLEMLRSNDALLKHYQQRFKFVLVDEFQDTNSIQYAWLKLLSGGHQQIFVVGDDDQSIYGWRGARVENILNFDQDFPNSTTVRLEQNYRSTSTILEAANHVIAKNSERLDKKLWTENKDDSLITQYAAMDAYEEAQYVVDQIKIATLKGTPRAEQAILYRSNAQSRIFEEILLRANIPYRIYGGLRFFDRMEIKDIISYLRLIVNPHDDISFERAITTPAKGVGAATIEKIRLEAMQTEVSLWTAMQNTLESQLLAKRAQNALMSFKLLIENLADALSDLTLDQFIQEVIDRAELEAHYKKEPMGRGEDRIENLNEFISASRQFVEDYNNDPAAQPLTMHGYLSEFLGRITLDSTANSDDDQADKVQLMTLHSSKGLEFEHVYLVGMDDGLFPSESSMNDPARLEEERRLAYVGITRAKRLLTLTTAASRMIHGKTIHLTPSCFVKDIPSPLVQMKGAKVSISKPMTARSSSHTNASQDQAMNGFALGQTVTHPVFGDGVITNFEGVGNHARVTVNFRTAGQKTLVMAYAKLTAI
ncbi:DNA helicase II [Wohlfahrtiimonas chitiniclastica]|uniref:DNA helicase II n=1 Tax=Wohlfahrtiimonas chitiniclastica TaxID=400946 RepID=UPI000B99385D|nr:DNA helicase II [Wohlfahrtiimonas chitiniclastica]OYQ74695.1 DNA helicase II [Wohlfahrtiimonas chitiniclastica]